MGVFVFNATNAQCFCFSLGYLVILLLSLSIFLTLYLVFVFSILLKYILSVAFCKQNKCLSITLRHLFNLYARPNYRRYYSMKWHSSFLTSFELWLLKKEKEGRTLSDSLLYCHCLRFYHLSGMMTIFENYIVVTKTFVFLLSVLFMVYKLTEENIDVSFTTTLQYS